MAEEAAVQRLFDASKVNVVLTIAYEEGAFQHPLPRLLDEVD